MVRIPESPFLLANHVFEVLGTTCWDVGAAILKVFEVDHAVWVHASIVLDEQKTAALEPHKQFFEMRGVLEADAGSLPILEQSDPLLLLR